MLPILENKFSTGVSQISRVLLVWSSGQTVLLLIERGKVRLCSWHLSL